ncbi:MAG: hypothetical protein JNM94_13725 [Phycisphaerae bacterium]|nr:hypothetical protein [Phycisphaerae bacterium]
MGGILLAIGLTAILVIAGRSLDMQQRGERDIVAATILDDYLSNILAEGPEAYLDMYSLSGRCDAPYDDYQYDIEIEEGALGIPYRVLVTITHERGQTWSCETYIAPKVGEEPDPIRTPEEPLDREGRYLEEEQRNEGR